MIKQIDTNLSEHLQKRVQTSCRVQSSCSPLHPTTHKHFSAHSGTTLVVSGAFVVDNDAIVVESGDFSKHEVCVRLTFSFQFLCRIIIA